MIRTDDGELSKTDKNIYGANRYPFRNISAASKKLKNNEDLSNEEINRLENFVDKFTTVSTNKNKVDGRVTRIVLEVNKHHHTKTSRKYDTSCIFLFPRYHSIKTIIARPISGVSSGQKTKILQKFNKILIKVSEVLMDEDAVSEIVRNIGEE